MRDSVSPDFTVYERVYELVVRYPSKKGVSSSVKNQEQRGVP
jgi:hypothetical protein